jgi:hypothetical protein
VDENGVPVRVDENGNTRNKLSAIMRGEMKWRTQGREESREEKGKGR